MSKTTLQLIPYLLGIYILIFESCSYSSDKSKELSCGDFKFPCNSNTNCFIEKRSNDTLQIRLKEYCQLFDYESLQIISTLIVYENYKHLNEFDELIFTFDNPEFRDSKINISYSKDLIDTTYNWLKRNRIFYELAGYVLQNYNQEELSRLNQIIDEFPDKVGVGLFDRFNKKDYSFWKLLLEYSLNCKKGDKEVKFQFFSVVQIALMSEYEPGKKDLKPLLEICSYDIDKIDSVTKEYLKEHYKK